jgi:hypothetical protein
VIERNARRDRVRVVCDRCGKQSKLRLGLHDAWQAGRRDGFSRVAFDTPLGTDDPNERARTAAHFCCDCWDTSLAACLLASASLCLNAQLAFPPVCGP